MPGGIPRRRERRPTAHRRAGGVAAAAGRRQIRGTPAAAATEAAAVCLPLDGRAGWPSPRARPRGGGAALGTRPHPSRQPRRQLRRGEGGKKTRRPRRRYTSSRSYGRLAGLQTRLHAAPPLGRPTPAPCPCRSLASRLPPRVSHTPPDRVPPGLSRPPARPAFAACPTSPRLRRWCAPARPRDPLPVVTKTPKWGSGALV